MYNFVTTSKSHYFSRNNDLIFFLGNFFTLKIKTFLKNEKVLNKPIVSFVVSKKIGPSVIRNKLKRRLRIIFNELSKSILYRNLSYILIAKPEINKLSFLELRSSIEHEIKILIESKKVTKHFEKISNIS